jgi:hypothetical protein
MAVKVIVVVIVGLSFKIIGEKQKQQMISGIVGLIENKHMPRSQMIIQKACAGFKVR